jgi:threonine dehydrogenase-like Zn-dependent dehydrogenase
MKRLVVTGPRQVEFEDVPVPDCPRDGVLAKAIVTAISSGTETRVYRRTPVDDEGTMQYPGIPFPDGPTENGYSMVGEVVEVGADVEGLSVGERVFLGQAHKEYAAVRASERTRSTPQFALPTCSSCRTAYPPSRL